MSYSAQLSVSQPDYLLALFGSQERHMHLYEEAFSVSIATRGEKLTILGEEEQVEKTKDVLETLILLMDRGIMPKTVDIITAIKLAQDNKLGHFLSLFDEVIGKNYEGQLIRPKTYGQLEYIRAINNNDVVIGIGPAGTGKTFLAVTLAVQALREGTIKRIVITRPAVEAGESLGFLPGDLKEKVDPYLRPIYDAFYSIYGVEHTERLMERGTIEIAPLAYMRGRTLEDAYVILDEAQNTTISQMKMFLTRLGFGSKMIVNGDITQIDLPKGVKSGLKIAREKLQNVKGLAFVNFTEADVVRHPIVAEIIKAFEDDGDVLKENKEADN